MVPMGSKNKSLLVANRPQFYIYLIERNINIQYFYLFFIILCIGSTKIFKKYSGTPLYEHPLNTDTRYYAPLHIFSLKLIRLIRTPRNGDTFSDPNVRNNGV